MWVLKLHKFGILTQNNRVQVQFCFIRKIFPLQSRTIYLQEQCGVVLMTDLCNKKMAKSVDLVCDNLGEDK